MFNYKPKFGLFEMSIILAITLPIALLIKLDRREFHDKKYVKNIGRQRVEVTPLSAKLTTSNGASFNVFIIEKDGYKLAVAVEMEGNSCAMIQLIDPVKDDTK